MLYARLTVLQVLRTIPFHQLDMRALSVEYEHGQSDKHEYAEFMKQQGYVVHSDIHFRNPSIMTLVNDFIFVKNTAWPAGAVVVFIRGGDWGQSFKWVVTGHWSLITWNTVGLTSEVQSSANCLQLYLW